LLKRLAKLYKVWNNAYKNKYIAFFPKDLGQYNENDF